MIADLGYRPLKVYILGSALQITSLHLCYATHESNSRKQLGGGWSSINFLFLGTLLDPGVLAQGFLRNLSMF